MVAGGRIGWLSSPTVPTHVTERRNATTDRAPSTEASGCSMVAGGRIGWLSSPTVPTHVTERRNPTTDRGQRPRPPAAGLLGTSCAGGDGDRSWCHGRGSTDRLLAACCGRRGRRRDRSWCHGRDSLTG